MDKISTGITGLDEMLNGGFPEKRIILVSGGPGSGKTVFALQFILNGLKKNEKGIYVTLEEPINLIKSNFKSLGWNLSNLESNGKLKTIDGSQLVFRSHVNQQHGHRLIPYISNMVMQIKNEVDNFGAKRLAIDPITSAIIHQRFPTDKRLEIMELMKTLRTLDCTTIITSEVTNSSGGDFYVEEYLADGVIFLSKSINDFKLTKTMRVEKMRGMKHDDQPRKYEIMSNGFKVYNTEPVKTY